MKKLAVFVLLFIFILTGCAPKNNDENTVRFHDKTFYKADLSQDTIEWLEWYNSLTETEQLSISYIPSDLYKLCGYDEAEDIPADMAEETKQ